MKDVVAELRVGVKDLAAEDRAGWVPLALSDRVRDLVGLTEVMQVELVRGLAGWDRVAAWAEDGAVTAVTWLKNNTTLTETEASGLLRVSRLYAQHASVAAGLDGGDLTVAKARILWRAERNRETAFAEVVDGFVELARDLSAADFAQVLGRWVELVDDQAPPDDSKRRFSECGHLRRVRPHRPVRPRRRRRHHPRRHRITGHPGSEGLPRRAPAPASNGTTTS